MQEAAQLPDSKVDASFADELFAKVIGLPAAQQDESYKPPHTQLQVRPVLQVLSSYQSSTYDQSDLEGGDLYLRPLLVFAPWLYSSAHSINTGILSLCASKLSFGCISALKCLHSLQLSLVLSGKLHSCWAEFLLYQTCVILQPAELEVLASKALKAALAEEQYERGVIIDGLNSQYLSPEVAAGLLLASLGLQKSCKFPALNPLRCCCYPP